MYSCAKFLLIKNSKMAFGHNPEKTVSKWEFFSNEDSDKQPVNIHSLVMESIFP